MEKLAFLMLLLPCAAFCLEWRSVSSSNIFNIIRDDFDEVEADFMEPMQELKKEIEKEEEKTLSSPPPPPPHEQTAKMSRYLCHYSNWLSMATISTRSGLQGTPFASVFSFSDGPLGNSTGVPYFYLTELDMSTKDLKDNPKASVTMSLAQGSYCTQKELDPEDPRCAHLILAGEVVQLDQDSEERAFAQEALFSRHPVMQDWPTSHHWFFAKLAVTKILLLDFFGGAIDVPLKDYYSVEL